MATWANGSKDTAFEKLYLVPGQRSLLALKAVGGECHHLTILLDRSKTLPPGTVFRPGSDPQDIDAKNPLSENFTPDSGSSPDGTQWPTLFTQTHNLQTLTISSPGDPTWPGLDPLSRTLVSIRTALESSLLLSLHTLRLRPIHASGLLHLRWAGLTAYAHAPSTASAVWQRLDTLEIQLLNPFVNARLSKPQRLAFRKVLHDYLGSFRRRLRVLRFHWVGGRGPNPLLLEAEGRRSAFSAPPVEWKELVEAWLGNVNVGLGVAAAIKKRARGLGKLMAFEDGVGNGGEDEPVAFDAGEGRWESIGLDGNDVQAAEALAGIRALAGDARASDVEELLRVWRIGSGAVVDT
ncbi:hypothetical protein B0A49_06382 [Cryomyces minteri]|uniref:Uncharacterized protein n=1 Tax=Cryomyces minteri TaxID=331657 RepID=A0A4U0X2C5_9PEZI|nr:hypothetical protein B0A49_06382 [Cryomyces minteri]